MDTREDKQLQPYNDETYVPREDAISLLDVVHGLAKHWRLIFFTTVIAGALTLVVLLLAKFLPQDSPLNPLPNIFAPQALILIQSSSGSSGLNSLLGNSGGSALSSLLGGAATNPTALSAALAQELLKENTIVDQIIQDFHIMDKFKDNKFALTGARNSVTKSLSTSFDLTTGILTVGFNNSDAEYATAVVNRMVTLLEQRFRNLTLDRVLRKKAFLEDQLTQVQSDLQNAENMLVAFQNRYKIVDIGTQTAEAAKRVADYQNQLYQLELQRQGLLMYSKPDSPSVIRIQNQIDQLHKFMNELESGFKVYSADAIPLDKVAELGVRFQNLQTEVQIQGKLYGTLRQEYETTKIEEQDNSGTFQIVEKAEVPELAAPPSKKTVGIVITVAAFVLSLLAALVLEYIEKAKNDPIEAEKLRSITQAFRRVPR